MVLSRAEILVGKLVETKGDLLVDQKVALWAHFLVE